MEKEEKQKKETGPKPSRRFASNALFKIASIIMASIAGICVVVFCVALYVNFVYVDEIFPGVHIGPLDFSGKTETEARRMLEEKIAALDASGIQVFYNGESQQIDSMVATEEVVDTAFPLYLFDTKSALQSMLSFGRGSNGLANSWDRLRAILIPKNMQVALAFQDDKFIAALRAKYGTEEKPAINANMAVNDAGDLIVTPSSSGTVFLYEEYAAQVKAQLSELSTPTITMSLTTQDPTVKEADVTAFLTTAEQLVARAPYKITWEDKTWELTAENVAQSLSVKSQESSFVLVFTPEGLDAFVKTIQSVVDIQAKDARFAISNGKVSEFQSSTAGRTVDIDALIQSLNGIIEGTHSSPIVLSVKEVEAEVTESNAESLGITELVAVAHTNFKGSPTNRRKNIANGVKLLNGILIKPGETFSLVKALSPITTANGYLAELVIKGNRTIPEVGGGLCQIGTTMFRVTLNAGLPIVERKNHSYRVSYYEPPVGMDATIYDPSPDFKFTNDYENYLLLQGYVIGDDIYF
jgi:vancomycin resistance protein YoaR